MSTTVSSTHIETEIHRQTCGFPTLTVVQKSLTFLCFDINIFVQLGLYDIKLDYMCNQSVTALHEHGSYRKTSDVKHTLVGIKLVDHSDAVGAAPFSAAPTTSSFST